MRGRLLIILARILDRRWATWGATAGMLCAVELVIGMFALVVSMRVVVLQADPRIPPTAKDGANAQKEGLDRLAG